MRERGDCGPLKKSNDAGRLENRYHRKVIVSKDSCQFGERFELVIRTFHARRDRLRPVAGSGSP